MLNNRGAGVYTLPVLITTSDDLASFCRRISGAPYVAVDTEFLREKTYWPTLCLVQVAYGDAAAAIDTLAPGLDLTPLLDLMRDRRVLKIFHSASQDMAVLYGVSGCLPAPIFDTQLAAMVCGYGEQPAYATLAAKIAGADVDKASQLTDWSLRPLTERQVDYALQDVTHLLTIYEALRSNLESTGRLEWLNEETAALTNEDLYRSDPMEQWRRIRLRRPTRRSLAVLREVAAWREVTAQRRNLPRNWVARDETLAEIAMHHPKSTEQLERVRGLSTRMARGAEGAEILAAVQRGVDLPADQCPQLPPRREPLNGHETMVALLQALLKIRCEAHGVAPQMVANRSDLDLIATSDEPDVKALRGWRKVVFGADAIALKNGQLALTGNYESVRVISLKS